MGSSWVSLHPALQPGASLGLGTGGGGSGAGVGLRHRFPDGTLSCHDSPHQLFQARCVPVASSRARMQRPAPLSALPRACEGALAEDERRGQRRRTLPGRHRMRQRRWGFRAASAQG